MRFHRCQVLVFLCTFVCLGLLGRSAVAQDASQLLRKVDSAEFAPEDISSVTTMVLVDQAGKKTARKLESYQKGSVKRLLRFLEPADLKNMAFLDMGTDQSGQDRMYVYLSAFRKVRRIAGHVKNKSFAGTDFSYEDLGTTRFQDRYKPVGIKEEAGAWILELVPKNAAKSQYSKAVMRVRKSDHLFESIVMYDRKGEKYKILTRSDFRKVGKYTIPFRASMKDLKKNHATHSRVEYIKCDTQIKDEIFSPDRLTR